MKKSTDINDILHPLCDTPYQAYLTNAIQVADVLDWILAQVGAAKVWQTSFSISEEFLRRLYFIQKKRPVTQFTLILDHKATNATLKLWKFISQVIQRTYLADNHSKILLVEAESGQVVSVITSQNLTRGNRHESAFITTDHQIYNTLMQEVQSLITAHSVPLTDLMNQRIST